MSKKKIEKNMKELIEEADEAFRNTSRRSEAKLLYEEALKIAKKEKRNLEIQYIQGKLDFLDEKWETAIKHFDEVIKSKIDFPEAWYYKGFALAKLNRHEKAVECYNKVLEIDPKYASAWNSKGNALYELSKYEEAVECYDKTLEIDPKYASAWNNKGLALYEISKYEEAVECYDKALEIDPKNVYAWYNKGNALYELNRHKEAVECYDKALEIDPKNVYAWYNKGNALYELNRHKEAVECYDKALEIDPKYASAWNNKGNALAKLNRYEEVIKCYDKALEIDPKNAYVWNNKGYTLYVMGKYEEAIKCYDKALEIDPEFWLAQGNRNLVLMIVGRTDEAKKEREKLYSEKKKKIRESIISEEEKKEKILEMDAKKEVINELKDKYIDILDAKKKYEKKLAESLKPRNEPLGDNFFLVLRRWNSYTPVIPTTTESNVGGGYFLYWKGKGIVIDPGFDFVDNLFNNNLRIYDINAVIITHAHVDHCSDFESVLTLLFEYNEKNEKKKIDVFMNLGAMKKFLGWIPIAEDKNALISRVYPLEKGIEYDLEDYNLRLKVTKALHDEVLSKAYSVGLIFELYGEGNYTEDNSFRIGYTSDTKHDECVENQYKGVDIIISHLGSIEENDFSLKEEKSRHDHLMLTGVISTIYKSNAKLAVVSEFGEELEEHRLTIVEALNRVFQRNNMAKCLAGDIGLKVFIPDLKVECRYCEEEKKYVDFNKILEGIDPDNIDKKSIVYYCKNCENIYKYKKREAQKKRKAVK